MRSGLCAVFFFSGASALVFENLWFRQAGLAFGNGVWASSLVLGSFMCGLGLGNALAARHGQAPARPVRAYGLLELCIAATGLSVVLVLPAVGRVLDPLAGALMEASRTAVLNGLRLSASFLLLVAPTTAMGATLPLLTRALTRGHPHFGENLGLLYGWNTLGAVAGALAVETLLVTRLGVRGAALSAAGLGVVTAVLAVSVSRASETKAPPTPDPVPGPVFSAPTRRVLAAAFLTGAALLALEVVWFRFLSMFCVGSSLTFALQLAVVLAGIGLGGLLAAAWMRRVPTAHKALGGLLALTGLAVIALYASFNHVLPWLGGIYFSDPAPVLAMAGFLTFPVSLLSGVVFTFLGAELHERVGVEAPAAGAVTLANTAGAALGALGAGFLLLPGLGMERSFALLAGLYGLAALLLPPEARAPASGPGRPLTWGLLGLYGLFMLLFPFGLMASLYIRTPLLKYRDPESRVLTVREGLTETALYLEHREEDQRLFLRLVTNGFSMSSTRWEARRYMGLYVHLPAAVHPRLRRVLLVSYGVGSTARALARTREIESIDVVDISRDILDLSSVPFPEPRENPLRDPRVRVHVEDGRAFLQATSRRFDLITSEPPPPKNAGVVNLYSREYFDLLRRRLEAGGIVTYWLPVHALGETGTKVVVRAFCDVFRDCAAFSGSNLDWMLVGTNGMRGPVSEERFRAQWDDPGVGADLREAGLEAPEQLGPLFLADADGLARLSASAPPLTDNWPNRLGPVEPALPLSLLSWLDAGKAREAFAASPYVAGLWPPGLRQRSLADFEAQGMVYELFLARRARRSVPLERIHEVLVATRARLPVLLALGSDPDRERAAKEMAGRGPVGPWGRFHLAASALADRDYERAAGEARGATGPGAPPEAGFALAYALCLSGRAEDARPLLPGLGASAREFLGRTFGRAR